MSCGALGYGEHKIEDIIREMQRHELTPPMRDFAKFLVLVAKAVHDVEWELYDDLGPGDSTPAIEAVLPSGFSLRCAIGEAMEAQDRLEKAIAKAQESEHA